MTDPDLHIRTRTLARIVGPYFLVMGATLALRAGAMALLLPAFMQDGALVLAAGAFTLMAGLSVLAAHHHFTSPAAIVISIVGIVAAVKGAFLMLAPELGAPLTAAVVRAAPLLIVVAAIMFIAGLWLTAVGWFSTARKT